MKYSLFFLLILIISCNQSDPKLQTEINDLKEKLTAAETTLAETTSDETYFIHTVFFWMKEEVSEEQKANFAKKGLGDLMKIPSIYKGYFGPPAMTPREVVDNSYDFALVCHFKNPAEQDAYQVDSVHLKFIEDYKNLWERVQVYDNLVE